MEEMIPFIAQSVNNSWLHFLSFAMRCLGLTSCLDFIMNVEEPVTICSLNSSVGQSRVYFPLWYLDLGSSAQLFINTPKLPKNTANSSDPN